MLSVYDSILEFPLSRFAMPQPIRKKCNIQIKGLAARPQHAAALGMIVSTSGRLEALLGWLLAFFSGGSAAITIPMFQSVTSTDAQRAMLEAAASKALSGAELAHFNMLMEDFRPRYRERSRVVHNLWGHSDDHPDKAIWCPADEAAAFMARVAGSTSASEVNAATISDLSIKCMTYSVKDLTDIADRLENYFRRVGSLLSDLMDNHPAIAAATSAPPESNRADELPLDPPPE